MEEKQETMFGKLPQNLADSIKSIVTRNGFTSYEIDSKKISTDGGSYMGVLFEIEIRGETVEGLKEINIFAKNIVDNINMPIYSVPGVFETEAWVYNELSAVFKEVQDNALITEDTRFKMPYSFDECNPKCIILEHLGKKGFKLYDRMEPMTLSYAELSVKALAKFHSLSFVIKEKEPDYFEEKIVTMKQPYIFGDDWHSFVKHISEYSISCLESDVRERVKDRIEAKVADYGKYMTDTSIPRTLCHGDYKLNNVMARETNGEITEVLPIDYQILHYGNPILDFIYFVFHGTDQEFRKHHLSYLKDLYHETVDTFLRKFNLDIEKFIPKHEFEKNYKERLDFGLMVNTFYAPFLFAVEGDAPDVTSQELSTLDFKVDDRFTTRYREIVDDFIQWGYI